MPKTSEIPTAPAVITDPSALPTHVHFALNSAGAKVTPESVAHLYQVTEAKRADWLAHSILLGTALLAKKAALGHGKFNAFLDQVSAKCATRGTFATGTADISVRTLKRYTQLARYYLDALTAPQTVHGSDSLAPLARATLDTGTPTGPEIAALITTPSESLPRITAWIAGRTLRELLADLTQADEAASAQERLEAAVNDTRPPTGKAPKTPAGHTHPNQLLLTFDKEWEDTVAPALQHIDEALSGHDPAILALPPADATRYWTAVADELTHRADLARQAAKAAQEDQHTPDDLLATH